MSSIDRATIRRMMGDLLARQGRSLPANDDTALREVGFRSLDFAELALRVETETGDALQFEAAVLRTIETVGDVLDFMERAASDGA